MRADQITECSPTKELYLTKPTCLIHGGWARLMLEQKTALFLPQQAERDFQDQSGEEHPCGK